MVDEGSQIVDESRWWDDDGLETELIEVVQDHLTVVTAEYEQRRVVHLCHEGRATAWHVRGPDAPTTSAAHTGRSVGFWQRLDGRVTMHLRPSERFEVVLVHVVEPLGAVITTKGVHLIVVHGARVEVPRGGHVVAPARNLAPRISVEIAGKEVVHPLNSIVPTKHVHRVLIFAPRRARAYGGRLPRGRHGCPHLRIKVIFVHVVEPGGAIVPTKQHETVLVHDAHVPEARRGWQALGLHCAPYASHEVEFVKVVEPLRSVVSTKQVERTLVFHHAVILAHPRRWAAGVVLDPAPSLGLKVELVKVVKPAGATIAPKHIHLCVHNHRRGA
mmetsp:Transcript_59023/g.163099  ORF Transcript_59023/g.163099 Transcript_59023/m.163099 type:complete len:330 (-) Transcript_59023:64-1053(-)